MTTSYSPSQHPSFPGNRDILQQSCSTPVTHRTDDSPPLSGTTLNTVLKVTAEDNGETHFVHYSSPSSHDNSENYQNKLDGKAHRCPYYPCTATFPDTARRHHHMVRQHDYKPRKRKPNRTKRAFESLPPWKLT